MRDKNQRIAHLAFRRSGVYSRKNADTHYQQNADAPPPGAADMFVCCDGRARFVEVKSGLGKTSFDMRELTEAQREWAFLQREVFGMETWVFLEMGKGRRGSADVGCWLMPYLVYVEVHQMIVSWQHALPLYPEHIRRIEMRERSLCASILFEEYELPWQNGSYRLGASVFMQTWRVFSFRRDALAHWREAQARYRQAGIR